MMTLSEGLLPPSLCFASSTSPRSLPRKPSREGSGRCTEVQESALWEKSGCNGACSEGEAGLPRLGEALTLAKPEVTRRVCTKCSPASVDGCRLGRGPFLLHITVPYDLMPEVFSRNLHQYFLVKLGANFPNGSLFCVQKNFWVGYRNSQFTIALTLHSSQATSE